MASYLKVTIIWAPQSGMNDKDANSRVRAPQAQAIRGLRDMGEHHELPQLAPANFWPPMRNHTAAEMGKSGQI